MTVLRAPHGVQNSNKLLRCTETSKRLTNYVEAQRWTTKPPPSDIVTHLLFRHILNCEGFGTNRHCNALIVSNDINISIMCYCSGLERLRDVYSSSVVFRCPKLAYVVRLINDGIPLVHCCARGRHVIISG